MKIQLLSVPIFSAYFLGISCRICDQLYSYKEAENCCKDEQASLFTINNSTELDILTRKMTNANLMSTWVPIIRHELDGFHWIERNGRISPALSNKPNTNKSCGLYDKKTNEIKPEHCSSSIGHICEIQNCTDCRTLGWDSVVCQQAETSCLIFACDNKNWYDARLTCRQKEQRLAVATSEPLKSALSRGEYACDYFWIGVRNTEWGPNKGEPQPGIPLWDVNEPSDVGTCSALFVAGDSHKLRARQCNKKRHVICGNIHSQIGNQKGEKEKEKQTSNSAFIVGLSTAGAVLLIVIVVFGVVMARLKSKRKKSMEDQRISEKSEKNGNEAWEPLLNACSQMSSYNTEGQPEESKEKEQHVPASGTAIPAKEDTPKAGYNKAPTLGKKEGDKHGEASEEQNENRQTGKGATSTPQRRDKAKEEDASDSTAGDNTVSAPGKKEGYKQSEATVDSEFPKEGTVKEKMAIFKQLESNKIRGSQAANGS